MALTVLQIAQEFCKRQGLPGPTTLVGAQDDLTKQVWGILNEGLSDLVQRYDWQQLTTQYTFQHAGGANYEALDLAATLPDFDHIVQRTFWDSTARIEVAGPLNEREWVTTTTMLVARATYCYRIRGDKLLIFGVPNPLSSVDFSFEYVTQFGSLDAGGVPEELYSVDASTPRLPSKVILSDLKWRWRKEKGLPYAEDLRVCEEMITGLISREPNSVLTLDPPDDRTVAGPGLLVAAGSWPL
jgi:hypothetical protein